MSQNSAQLRVVQTEMTYAHHVCDCNAFERSFYGQRIQKGQIQSFLENAICRKSNMASKSCTFWWKTVIFYRDRLQCVVVLLGQRAKIL